MLCSQCTTPSQRLILQVLMEMCLWRRQMPGPTTLCTMDMRLEVRAMQAGIMHSMPPGSALHAACSCSRVQDPDYVASLCKPVSSWWFCQPHTKATGAAMSETQVACLAKMIVFTSPAIAISLAYMVHIAIRQLLPACLHFFGNEESVMGKRGKSRCASSLRTTPMTICKPQEGMLVLSMKQTDKT